MKQMFTKTLRNCGLLAVAGALLLAGCRQGHKANRFETSKIEGKQYMKYLFTEPESDTVYARYSYSLVWPAKGVLSPEAERELIVSVFDDSTSTSFDEALQRWSHTYQFWCEMDVKGEPLDTIDETRPFAEAELRDTVIRDSNLVRFVKSAYIYVPDAAHGHYWTDNLTVDLATGKVVHLSDLVDTNLMGEAIARAVQDLEVNREVRECLFPEFQNVERMPLSQDFFIDSTRSSIVIDYGLYWITPYACGIQSVVLPIFWLSKHVPLTPYAKELFGPGSSLE